ncbi:transcriptional regulator [Candidatus Poribacteria bacterium]|nr:transcriptional regulator [Candidatus Poribacteria bacterium]
MEKLTTWHEFLIEKLANREKAMSYLQVSLEEYLIDGDMPFFLKGIRNVVEAQGGISEVAKRAGISPKVLSKFLFGEEPLQLDIFSAILKALGWQLSIEPLTTENDNSEFASEQLPTSNEPLETSTEQVSELHPA